ncbi:MAG: response regulator [Chloroflexi bacterium]|nr:response regulator [Chloroflexota bacterium]
MAKREVIKNSRLFWNLSPGQIDQLVDICEEREVVAGYRIFTEGEEEPNLYIVESGRVALDMEIRIGSRTRRNIVIDVITPNQTFGLSSLSDSQVNSNTATAIENTRLLVMNGRRVTQLFARDTNFGYSVMQQLVSVVDGRLQNAKRTLAHVLSVTSHDLRAPLATVQSSLDAIIGRFVGDINSRQEELLKGSKQRLYDLMHMIDNILDISYIEIKGTDFEKVDLAAVIASSVGDVEGMARAKNIWVRNNAGDSIPRVLGLPKRLRQVVTNLLSNGVKFTPVGGAVTISAEDSAENVKVKISDTGIGIPPDELPKLFADFYRGMKVDAEGVGLGLAISKKIVQAHGGTIYAESPDPDTGLGSRFSFTIPKVIGVTRNGAPEAKHTIAGAKVIVADDDPEMRKVTALVLESQGYVVRTAADGEDALAKITEDRPDILILDLMMPKLDGFEVCKRLDRFAGPHGERIPVIILSAVGEESSRKRYELETSTDLLVDDYIRKPVSPPVLLQRVEKILIKSKSPGGTSFNITKGGKKWSNDLES